ncbi:hypothetical protein ILYODFUR_032317 [Ilyodon furcidens]|uniref:Uncharacterized protein n=1 Tax=Ilyodon furcidens TaxID=33524 RepID=A0ABV0ULC6_9TELE
MMQQIIPPTHPRLHFIGANFTAAAERGLDNTLILLLYLLVLARLTLMKLSGTDVWFPSETFWSSCRCCNRTSSVQFGFCCMKLWFHQVSEATASVSVPLNDALALC